MARMPTMPRAARLARYRARSLTWTLLVLAAGAALVIADRAGLLGRPALSDADDLRKYDGQQFRVVKVVDGDTLDVDASDDRNPSHSAHTRVRLWGVDTPETKKPDTPVGHFGPEASAFTAAAAMGQTVTLKLEHSHTRDKYGRLLAYVILPDGRMLNRELVAQGCGYADPRFGHSCKAEFERLQRTAMDRGAGLWAGATQADLPYYLQDKITLASRGGK